MSGAFKLIPPATVVWTSILIDIAVVKYAIVEVEIIFRIDTANLLQIYILTSNNTNISITTPPPDRNVFSLYTPSGFFIGEYLVKHINLNYVPPEGDVYIKVHGINNALIAQTINVTVSIEEV